MSQGTGVALLAVLVAGLFAAMALGWRHRTARASAAVPALPEVPDPDSLGAVRAGPVEATYLATAPAEDRLARVAAHGLAVRGRADVVVHDAGVLVRRVGAPDLFVPAGDLVAASRASGMAGTAVGKDRVVVLRWRCGTVTLDTGVLPRHAADVGRLLAALPADAAHTEVPHTDVPHTDDGASGPTTDGSPA